MDHNLKLAKSKVKNTAYLIKTNTALKTKINAVQK